MGSEKQDMHFPFAIYVLDRFQGQKYMHSDDSWIYDVLDKGWLIPFIQLLNRNNVSQITFNIAIYKFGWNMMI